MNTRSNAFVSQCVPPNASTINRYANAADRARLLYRFPTAPNAGRTLELYRTGEPLMSDRAQPGASTCFCRLGPQIGKSGHQHASMDHALPYAPASFDLVVLHNTLDDLATVALPPGKKYDPSTLLSNILTVLAPGGVLAGCVNNRWAIKPLLQRIRGPATASLNAHSPGRFSLRSLRTKLSASGYSDIHLFTLLPNSAAPFKLIDTDPTVSRAAFRHELQIMRRHLGSGPSYVLRRIAVEAGLNRHFEQSIFFWASKPC